MITSKPVSQPMPLSFSFSSSRNKDDRGEQPPPPPQQQQQLLLTVQNGELIADSCEDKKCIKQARSVDNVVVLLLSS